MSDELRAADRLRKFNSGDMSVYETDYGLHADRAVLADAYLVEHPADDGEPVTEEWLRSVGFTQYNEETLSSDMVFLSLWIDRSLHNTAFLAVHWPLTTKYEVYWSCQGFSLYKPAYPKTRRDVRNLAKCLGVELKENNQ